MEHIRGRLWHSYSITAIKNIHIGPDVITRFPHTEFYSWLNDIFHVGLGITRDFQIADMDRGSHFTHTWKTLAWPHHFSKSGGLDPSKQLNSNPQLFIEVLVQSQECEWPCLCVLGISVCLCFYDFNHGIYNCSDSVVCYGFHLIIRSFFFFLKTMDMYHIYIQQCNNSLYLLGGRRGVIVW